MRERMQQFHVSAVSNESDTNTVPCPPGRLAQTAVVKEYPFATPFVTSYKIADNSGSGNRKMGRACDQARDTCPERFVGFTRLKAELAILSGITWRSGTSSAAPGSLREDGRHRFLVRSRPDHT